MAATRGMMAGGAWLRLSWNEVQSPFDLSFLPVFRPETENLPARTEKRDRKTKKDPIFGWGKRGRAKLPAVSPRYNCGAPSSGTKKGPKVPIRAPYYQLPIVPPLLRCGTKGCSFQSGFHRVSSRNFKGVQIRKPLNEFSRLNRAQTIRHRAQTFSASGGRIHKTVACSCDGPVHEL